MLSSIARAAARRVGAGAHCQAISIRAFPCARDKQRAGSSQISNGQLRAHLPIRRSYATATATTTPKKTAEKRKTKPSTTGVTKSKTATKKPAKKAVPKSKKKLVAKKKAPPKKRVAPKKKILTEEDKELLAAKKEKTKAKQALEKAKQERKQDKLIALLKEEPRSCKNSAWAAFFVEYVKGYGGSGSEASKEACVKYRAMSSSERERYEQLASEMHASYTKLYKQFIEAHTPDQILEANRARNRIRARSGKHTPFPLVDERLPKRTVGPFAMFSGERWRSGDLQGISLVDGAAQVSKEWQGLSASERQVYQDKCEADKHRYSVEYQTVFNRPRPIVSEKTS